MSQLKEKEAVSKVFNEALDKLWKSIHLKRGKKATFQLQD
jgi:hypothetical protein